ncbi:hypothetical protein FQN55_007831 [Onygenales sp. PD_40]|nr:hypothetical protein FQN55_007831 [Onygenales sp. PD_40]KAK2773558.1 hypothetical protein FQN52_004537 [Onygenales sp. PD_12]
MADAPALRVLVTARTDILRTAWEPGIESHQGPALSKRYFGNRNSRTQNLERTRCGRDAAEYPKSHRKRGDVNSLTNRYK